MEGVDLNCDSTSQATWNATCPGCLDVRRACREAPLLPMSSLVAHCVTGQARGFLGSSVWSSVRERAVSLGGTPHFYFVLSDVTAADRDAVERVVAHRFEKLISLTIEEEGQETWPEQSCTGGRKWPISPARSEEMCETWSGKYYQQFRKMAACFKTATAHEATLGQSYAFVAKWRPDAQWETQVPFNLGCLAALPRPTILAQRPTDDKCHEQDLNDQFLIVPRALVSVYYTAIEKLWTQCVTFDQMARVCATRAPKGPVCRWGSSHGNPVGVGEDYLVDEERGDWPPECYHAAAVELAGLSLTEDVRKLRLGSGVFVKGTPAYDRPFVAARRVGTRQILVPEEEVRSF